MCIQFVSLFFLKIIKEKKNRLQLYENDSVLSISISRYSWGGNSITILHNTQIEPAFRDSMLVLQTDGMNYIFEGKPHLIGKNLQIRKLGNAHDSRHWKNCFFPGTSFARNSLSETRRFFFFYFFFSFFFLLFFYLPRVSAQSSGCKS